MIPDPDVSDATLRALLEPAEKVRNAGSRSATAHIPVLSPDIAAAVLRDLLERGRARPRKGGGRVLRDVG
ncbi:MAG: hypothetical protein HY681_12995 [Chloroflexi bacterium]|nr:hypothetical protein [Chloroflexota bacterium]